MHCISLCLCCVGSQTACNFATDLLGIDQQSWSWVQLSRDWTSFLDLTSFNSQTVSLKAYNLSQPQTACLRIRQCVSESYSMSQILLVGQAVSNWKAEHLELRSSVYESLPVWQHNALWLGRCWSARTPHLLSKHWDYRDKLGFNL